MCQMSGGHKHRYKNAGLSADELRRRREEEGVQLRKQKREQQLLKRRNVNIPTPNAPDVALQVHSFYYRGLAHTAFKYTQTHNQEMNLRIRIK